MSRTIPKVSAVLVLFLQLASLAHAQIDVNTDELDFLPGEDKKVDIFVTDILNWVIGAATLVCVVMLVYSGYMYMTAGGDEEKVRTAQKTITGSLIGLVISLLSLVLVNFVLETFLGKPPVG